MGDRGRETKKAATRAAADPIVFVCISRRPRDFFITLSARGLDAKTRQEWNTPTEEL